MTTSSTGNSKQMVGLSGMLMVKGTPLENIHQAPNQDDMSGTLVSENVIGVVHDHFITFHLDLDIDNTDNSFVKVNLVKEETPPGQSPRKSYLKAKRNVAATENDAKIKLKLYDPSEFHVINPLKRSRLGNSAGYKIIWVTPYNRTEQWAGGFSNRPIENRDIVLCNPVLRAAPYFEKDLPVCRPTASS
ncbi:hypothetical protein AAG906_033855 [Vitis piasezkii]